MKQCFFQTHGGIIQRAFYAHSLNVYLICILVLLYTVQMAGAEENHEKKIGPTAEMVKFCKLMWSWKSIASLGLVTFQIASATLTWTEMEVK